MILTSEKHLRGNVHAYTFTHRTRKLGKIEIQLNSINITNAQQKAWKDVSKRYKALKDKV